MSLSYQPLEPVLVKDPRTIVDNKRVYAILKCGKQTNYKRWTTNSISTSNINFSTPPPSSGIIVDRKITLTLPMRIKFIVKVPASVSNVAVAAVKQNEFAPRAFPIHSMLNTIQLTINNCSITQNIGEIIHALLRYNTVEELMAMDYSQTPACLDTYCSYEKPSNDAGAAGGDPGATDNPLGVYTGKSFYGIAPRGGFAYFKVIKNDTVVPSAIADNAVANLECIVDLLCTEQIMMSPLYWGGSNASGFTNVVSMDWVFNFFNNAGIRAISFARRNAAGNAKPDTFTNQQIVPDSNFELQLQGFSPDFSFGASSTPTLNITYITPDGPYAVAPTTPITYPYFSIDKFITKAGTAITNTRNPAVGLQPGAIVQPEKQIVSNNIQLSSIPRRVYIYVRPSLDDLLKYAWLTDCFYSIEAINVQFGNRTGLFAEASKEQLYNISKKNHCAMSWSEWSGGPVYGRYVQNNAAGVVSGVPLPIGTIGSVFCFEFATDLGLEPNEAPGLGQGSYNFQVRVIIKNPNFAFPPGGGGAPPAPNPNGAASLPKDEFSWNALIPELYVVPVYEGSFTITGLGSAMTQNAVISYADIRDAQQSPVYNYKDIQEVNGGNFMSGIKSLVPKLKNLNQFMKDNKVVSRAADVVSYVPGMIGDVAKDVSNIANKYGYGYDGGVVLGGAKMTKSQLKNRLKNR